MRRYAAPPSRRFPSGAATFAVLFFSAAPAASQGTAEQREACTPDAVRLCSDAIPDVERTTACMQAHQNQLSRACRRVFEAEQRAPSGRALEEGRRAVEAPEPTDDEFYAPRRSRPDPDEGYGPPRRVERAEPPPYDDGLGPRRYLYLTPRGLEAETPDDAN